jgi:hypothetical protein
MWSLLNGDLNSDESMATIYVVPIVIGEDLHLLLVNRTPVALHSLVKG